MKRCPTCNSTYTNDTLRFCLQDGAALVDADDAPYSSDRQRPSTDEDTLQISGAAAPSTDAIDARAAQTSVTPPAPETAIAGASFRRRRPTRADEEEGPSSARAINIPLVAGITAIIVLLLVIVGIGIALLMRGRGEGRRRTANEATRNANSRSGHEPDAEALNSNDRVRRPDMTGEFSPAAARVEAKVLRGQSVTANDIAGLPRAELRRLRNTVYARHGRIFERLELQQYFDGRPWYKKRDDYTDNDLTPIDRDNINLIRAAEDRSN